MKDTVDSYRIFLSVRAFLQLPLEESEKAFDNQEDAHPLYKRLFRMVTHQGHRTEDAELKYLALAVLILQLVEDTGHWRKDLYEKEALCSRLKALKMAHKLIQIQDCNTHPICSSVYDGGGSEVGLSRIGNAINAILGSSLNHSCAPNTARINRGHLTLLVATQSLEKGQEVHDIYSMHHSEVSRDLRRTWLKDNFFFECGCKACAMDYPEYGLLPSKLPSPATAAALHEADMGLR